METEAENLDGMTRDDLKAYGRDASRPMPLREYATIKQQAMKFRADGAIATAQRLEAECERIYEKLPAALQW